MTIYIKKGDTARTLTDTLTLNGSAIDLTGATVVLVWKVRGGATTRLSASIVSAAAGTVSYALLSAQVDTAATVDVEWEITFSDTTVLTVPTRDAPVIMIVEDYG